MSLSSVPLPGSDGRRNIPTEEEIAENLPAPEGAAQTPKSAPVQAAIRTQQEQHNPALAPWLRAQSVNVVRHTAALRPFRSDEFGKSAASPTEAHIQAANQLISRLRIGLMNLARQVNQSVENATLDPTPGHLQSAVSVKERAHDWVRAIEQVWDFYFELFGQRQSQYADWLLGTDRIALDCYQAAYRGIGVTKSVPTPPPFSYMRTGFSPATFRRLIPLRRLGSQLNPFPLIQLPYHRLVNPWTLGAVLHEVSHNLQNDLGLDRQVPLHIGRRLLGAGFPPALARMWMRWNRETFADMSALLLGGPAIVASLMDVVGRSPQATLTFSPTGPHPTPYLRALISTELLRRMGFPEEARSYRRMWMRIYPNPRQGNIPATMLETFPQTSALVVDEICFRPYSELGDRSLAQVMNFEHKDQHMIEEAARRLSAGVDPGIIPERFLIGAARLALDERLTSPGKIHENFYKELARR